ncbi:MAG: hypothetical protein ACI9W2_004162, partial [Gammaproteobacteria bacterium]
HRLNRVRVQSMRVNWATRLRQAKVCRFIAVGSRVYVR